MQWRNSRRTTCANRFGDAREVQSPTRLEGHSVIRVQCQTGSTNRCCEWRASGEPDSLETDLISVVTKIAGGVVHICPLHSRGLERAIYAVELSRISKAFERRPAV